jgi:SAM-dependent methyltransferase
MSAELLACPVCQGALADNCCAECGRRYTATQGVTDFTPNPPPDERVRARWGLWEQLEANGADAYELDPPSSLSVGDREDVRAFAEFCRMDGRVLDVGCGPQELPGYALGQDQFFGIDPLRGVQPRAFSFVQGIAEYLPFRSGVFDRVLFATSIDHVLVPELALAEARRVSKSGGEIAIWLGEPTPVPIRERWKRRSPEPLTKIDTPQGVVGFEVPAGATDAFHVAHPAAKEIRRWLKRVGLTVSAVERPLAGSCFIRAVRA